MAPEAGVEPGRMKPAGMATELSSSAITSSNRSTAAAFVVAKEAFEDGLVASSAPSA